MNSLRIVFTHDAEGVPEVLGTARQWFVRRSKAIPHLQLFCVPELELKGRVARNAPHHGLLYVFPQGAKAERDDLVQDFHPLHGSVTVTARGVSVFNFAGVFLPDATPFDLLSPTNTKLISESAKFVRDIRDGHDA